MKPRERSSKRSLSEAEFKRECERIDSLFARGATGTVVIDTGKRTISGVIDTTAVKERHDDQHILD